MRPVSRASLRRSTDCCWHDTPQVRAKRHVVPSCKPVVYRRIPPSFELQPAVGDSVSSVHSELLRQCFVVPKSTASVQRYAARRVARSRDRLLNKGGASARRALETGVQSGSAIDSGVARIRQFNGSVRRTGPPLVALGSSGLQPSIRWIGSSPVKSLGFDNVAEVVPPRSPSHVQPELQGGPLQGVAVSPGFDRSPTKTRATKETQA